jgi:hypothetical protein
MWDINANQLEKLGLPQHAPVDRGTASSSITFQLFLDSQQSK